jgi:hypothetical protein
MIALTVPGPIGTMPMPARSVLSMPSRVPRCDLLAVAAVRVDGKWRFGRDNGQTFAHGVTFDGSLVNATSHPVLVRWSVLNACDGR